MQSHNRFKEIFIVLFPSIILLGWGLYLLQVERVSAPGASRMYISNIQFVPASGLSNSQGTSHRITVTIDHPWPRPKWWGRGTVNSIAVDALATHQGEINYRHFNTKWGQMLYTAAGGAITWTEHQKQHLEPKDTSAHFLFGGGTWNNDKLVFSHPLPLQDLPASSQQKTLTFQGLYYIEGQKPLHVTHVIRKAGEQMLWNRSHDTGGELVSIQAKPFVSWEYINSQWEDSSDVTIKVSHPASAKDEPVVLYDYDWELVDARGHVLKADQKNIIIAYSGTPPVSTPMTTGKDIKLRIKRAFVPLEPLTLHGKVSINNQWPISLSVRLPLRSKRVPPPQLSS